MLKLRQLVGRVGGGNSQAVGTQAATTRQVQNGQVNGKSRLRSFAESSIQSCKALFRRQVNQAVVPNQELTDLARGCAPTVEGVISKFDGSSELVARFKPANFRLTDTEGLSRTLLSKFDDPNPNNKPNVSLTDTVFEGVRQQGDRYSFLTPWNRNLDRVGNNMQYRIQEFAFDPRNDQAGPANTLSYMGRTITIPVDRPFESYARGIVSNYLNLAKTDTEVQDGFEKRLASLLRNEDGSVNIALTTMAEDLRGRLENVRSNLRNGVVVPGDTPGHLTVEIAKIVKSEGFVPYLIALRTFEATLTHGINFHATPASFTDNEAFQVKADLVRHGYIDENFNILPDGKIEMLKGSKSAFGKTVGTSMEYFVNMLKDRLKEVGS